MFCSVPQTIWCTELFSADSLQNEIVSSYPHSTKFLLVPVSPLDRGQLLQFWSCMQVHYLLWSVLHKKFMGAYRMYQLMFASGCYREVLDWRYQFISWSIAQAEASRGQNDVHYTEVTSLGLPPKITLLVGYCPWWVRNLCTYSFRFLSINSGPKIHVICFPMESFIDKFPQHSPVERNSSIFKLQQPPI